MLGFKEVMEMKFKNLRFFEDFHLFFLKVYVLNPIWRDPLDHFYLPYFLKNFVIEIKHKKERSKLSAMSFFYNFW